MKYIVKKGFVDKETKKDHSKIGLPYEPRNAARAEELVKKGFIETAPSDPATDEPKELADMTKAELVAYAEENELDVDGRLNKAELLAAIQEAEAGADE